MELPLIFVALGAIGCVPSASIPPPQPLAKGVDAELAVGAGGAIWLDSLSAPDNGLPEGMVTVSGRHRAGRYLTIGGQLSAGFWTQPVQGGFLEPVPTASGGVEVRFQALDRERFALGVSAGGGFLYARAGVPMAWRLGESWLGTHPTVGVVDGMAMFDVPVVWTIPISDTGSASLQLGARYWDGPMAVGALALSRTW